MIEIKIDFGNDGFSISAKLFKDGNQWCVLAGSNLQEGVCGFGNTISEAIIQFKEVVRNI